MSIIPETIQWTRADLLHAHPQGLHFAYDLRDIVILDDVTISVERVEISHPTWPASLVSIKCNISEPHEIFSFLVAGNTTQRSSGSEWYPLSAGFEQELGVTFVGQDGCPLDVTGVRAVLVTSTDH